MACGLWPLADQLTVPAVKQQYCTAYVLFYRPDNDSQGYTLSVSSMILPFNVLQLSIVFACVCCTTARVESPATTEKRKLITSSNAYQWHKSTIKSLQSPIKDKAYQYFGNAIDADRNLVIIGAPGDNVMNYYGSVSIYETDKWELVEYLEPDNAQKGDLFGGAVSISGWDALIGAHK